MSKQFIILSDIPATRIGPEIITSINDFPLDIHDHFLLTTRN